jgi:glycosyltransferase A (GT-A) superfamily protein (DUF2064 family)
MSGAIAIFVKTPGYSAVKTRLAETAGGRFAREWHERAALTVAAVAEAAAARSNADVYWAVAEPAAIADGAWPRLATLAQGDGGLGARMARVHTELVRRHGYGVLLGADSPQVGVDLLVEALHWLTPAGAPRQAMGPASDGGFWLYGANRTIATERWERVPYSQTDTAQRFRTAFEDRGDWLVLPVLTDVDRAEDLAPMRRELAALAPPLQAQQALGAWLQQAGGIPGPVEGVS